MRPGGLLEILGREDSQVKINGFRIELGEIESTVAEHRAVQDSCVIVAGVPPQRQYIVAFATPRIDSKVGASEKVDYWANVYDEVYDNDDSQQQSQASAGTLASHRPCL